MSYLLAIDPGISGALAIYDQETHDVLSWDMPATAPELCRVLIGYSHDIDRAWLELVHSFPGQGVSSTWKFACNYGIIQGVLGVMGVSYEDVSPQKWQKLLGNLPKDKADRKKEIKRKAQNYFPKIKVTLKNADALAILMVMISQAKETVEK